MIDWIIVNPAAATALATSASALATTGLVLVGLAQCWLIWRGLRSMDRVSAERNRRMDIQERESERRHEEVMRRMDEDSQRRDEDSQRRHEESMRALEALIQRTGPHPAPAE